MTISAHKPTSYLGMGKARDISTEIMQNQMPININNTVEKRKYLGA